MKITIEIPDNDILVALNNGSETITEWAEFMDIDHVRCGSPRAEVEVRSRASRLDPFIYPLNIERGIQMMVIRTKEGQAVGANLRAWNPHQCNAFIQFAAFGEIRYPV